MGNCVSSIRKNRRKRNKDISHSIKYSNSLYPKHPLSYNESSYLIEYSNSLYMYNEKSQLIENIF